MPRLHRIWSGVAVANVHQCCDPGTVLRADHGPHRMPDQRPVAVAVPVADRPDRITVHGPDPSTDRLADNPDADDDPTYQ